MSDPSDKHGPASGEPSSQERAQFEARISELGERLGKVRSHRKADMDEDADAEMRGRGMAYGMRMAAELVGAVIVGGAIGWGLDKWLGSTPWLFLLFFVLGFAAGILNVVRAYEGMQKEIMVRTGGRIGNKVPDDED